MNGRIISINSGFYEVLLEDNSTVNVRCAGRLRNYRVDKSSDFQIRKNRYASKIETSNVKLSPKVGDYCEVDTDLITRIYPRKNSLIRPDVANIDQVLLVFAAKEPAFSYLLFVLLYMPCLSALGAIAKEFSLKWMGFVIIWTTGQAYLLSTLFYQSATISRNFSSSFYWISGIIVTELLIFTALFLAGKGKKDDSF